MEVYFGGAFQGKLDYVLKKKGNLKVADGRDCDEKRLQSADVVNHLHSFSFFMPSPHKSSSVLPIYRFSRFPFVAPCRISTIFIYDLTSRRLSPRYFVIPADSCFRHCPIPHKMRSTLSDFATAAHSTRPTVSL